VHAHDSKAAGLAALACARHSGLAWVCHRRLSYGLGSGRLSRRKYRNVSRWIAVSNEVCRSLEAAGVAAGSCEVIPSALDVNAVRAAAEAGEPEAVRHQLGIDADAPVVGIFGALVRQKGHEGLIAAAPAVVQAFPQIRFLVVGEGRLRQNLEHQVAEAGLGEHFLFLGFRHDVPVLMRVCTLVVAPSIDGEGSPAAVKEAMAVGKAVVASDLAAHREVLGAAGLFFPVADHVALAQAVKVLLADTGQRRNLVSLAGPAVERFRPAIVAEATIAVYREAVAGVPV
jgi:glycosyltransferase involved in cell wall biosynthesis